MRDQSEWESLIGQVVVWWARVEHIVHSGIVEISRMPAAQPIRCRKFPKAWSEILSEWAKLRNAVLPHNEEAVAQAVTILKEAADLRNAVAHGLLSPATPDTADTATFTCLDRDPDEKREPSFRSRDISKPELRELIERLARLQGVFVMDLIRFTPLSTEFRTIAGKDAQ